MHIGHFFEVGHCHVKIVHDEDAEMPNMDDEAVIMAVLHRRYINPAQDRGLTDQQAIEDFSDENCGDSGDWVAFPLFMYDHSGTVYRVSDGGNPFSCPWDSGRVGALFLKKNEFTNPREAADAICEEYTDWANGNCWGYIIETPDDEHADSCWGFIGDPDADHIVSEARAAAEHFENKILENEAQEMESERPDLYDPYVLDQELGFPHHA